MKHITRLSQTSPAQANIVPAALKEPGGLFGLRDMGDVVLAFGAALEKPERGFVLLPRNEDGDIDLS